MPTGYTSKLYDGEQDFEDFALAAARNFGALVEMRDSSLDATIPETFEPSPYHTERLGQAADRLIVVLGLTDAECTANAASEYGLWVVERQQAEDTRQARLARYEDMRARVLAWTPPTDEHTGLRDFMVQQLDESIRFDCGEWYPTAPTRDGEVWRAEQLAKASRDIEYHEREMAEDRRRAAERTAWVRALRESLTPEPVK